MFEEPWVDIADYPKDHRVALELELEKEIKNGHILFGLLSKVLAKREDCDVVMVQNERGYFIVHLTWSGKAEKENFPLTEHFETLDSLKVKLAQDTALF